MDIMKVFWVLALGLGLLLLGGCAALSPAAGKLMDGETLFTERDLMQTADLSGAAVLTVRDGEDLSITEAGVYVLTGAAKEVTVRVEAGKEAEVQLVLDGLSIENADAPCIYAAKAARVYLTTAGDSSLRVTGAFAPESGADGAVFSKADLTLNGDAKLTVASPENGVVSRDSLTVTGGSYEISAGSKALQGKDSIRISGGAFALTAGTDGLHAENNGDENLGWIYIGGGAFAIQVGDDAIHAASLVQIDGGSFSIAAAEGIEGTYIQINGGELDIRAGDDGLNAGHKSSAYRPTIEITGGRVTITADAGDTDCVDSNGDILISGGTVEVTGDSAFDCDGKASFTGGTVIVNGRKVKKLP